MNRNPEIRGIMKYWKPGEDDRVLLKDRGLPRRYVDLFLDALWRVVSTRRRTKFVGFGAFEWRPWRKRLPTGKMVETWRLAFKPGRYLPKYKGETR